MIYLKYIETEDLIPANLKPWQVLITIDNSVLTSLEMKKTEEDFFLYRRWIARKFSTGDEAIVEELFRLYKIHNSYKILELIGLEGEPFISCIKRILDNSIIGGIDVYK